MHFVISTNGVVIGHVILISQQKHNFGFGGKLTTNYANQAEGNVQLSAVG